VRSSAPPLLPPPGGAGAPAASLYRTNFTELRLIATGGFGKVYLVRSNTDDKEYALKKVPPSL